MARRLYQRTVGRCRPTSGRHYDGSRGRFVWDAFLFSGVQARHVEAKSRLQVLNLTYAGHGRSLRSSSCLGILTDPCLSAAFLGALVLSVVLYTSLRRPHQTT